MPWATAIQRMVTHVPGQARDDRWLARTRPLHLPTGVQPIPCTAASQAIRGCSVHSYVSTMPPYADRLNQAQTKKRHSAPGCTATLAIQSRLGNTRGLCHQSLPIRKALYDSAGFGGHGAEPCAIGCWYRGLSLPKTSVKYTKALDVTMPQHFPKKKKYVGS